MKREIASIVVLSLVVAAIASAASAGHFRSGSNGGFASSSFAGLFGFARVSRTIDASFDVAPNQSLEFNASSFDVSFVRGTGTALRVHGIVSAANRAALDGVRVTSQQSNGRRIVSLEMPSGINFFNAHFTVEVPRVAALAVVSSSGDVQAADLSAPLDIHTSSGDVTVSRPGAATTLRTTAGDVIVRDAAGSVGAQTSSGDVTVRQAAGNVRAQTSSGDVRVFGLRGSLSSSSSSGDQTIALADGWAGSTLALRSNSGDVDVTVPRNFHGTLGTSTISGDVNDRAGLPRASGAPVLNITTSSGDITIHH